MTVNVCCTCDAIHLTDPGVTEAPDCAVCGGSTEPRPATGIDLPMPGQVVVL